MIEIRAATTGDVSAVAAFLRDYMREVFGPDAVWAGSPEALARDGFGLRFEMMVAARDGAVVGFVGWQNDYDLHHCISGGELLDMYVHPDVRGLGLALRLVAAVAARIRARGAAFRTVAELAGRPARAIIRGLPDHRTNFDP